MFNITKSDHKPVDKESIKDNFVIVRAVISITQSNVLNITTLSQWCQNLSAHMCASNN